MRRREECSRCGRMRRVFFTPGVCSECLGLEVGGICISCGIEDRLHSGGQCERCVLIRRTEEFFGDCGTAGRVIGQRLAASPNPRSSLSWLEHSPTAHLLLELLRPGQVPSHEDLDAIKTPQRQDGKADRRQAIENARMILVATGVLTPRHALASRYEGWARQVLANVDRAADHWTLMQFHRHRLLPTLEARCEAGKATLGTLKNAQGQLRAAIELLVWAAPKGGLAGLDRSGVDVWLAGPSTRYQVREFLLWAIRQRLLDLPLSAVPRRAPQSPPIVEDYQVRIDSARLLLEGINIPADVRVAGLLVVLYGQHLSRIVSLKREDVDVSSTPPRIKLGMAWLELPEPMARHIADLLARGPRRGAPFVEDAKWLFLGDGPGTHLSSDRLSVKLAGYGIHAQAMRNTSLFQLAATVQPRTLARLLGLHITTAVDWVNKSGGVYANYWEQVLDDDDAEDLDLLDQDAEALETTDDGDPDDLLDELGIL